MSFKTIFNTLTEKYVEQGMTLLDAQQAAITEIVTKVRSNGISYA